MYKKKQHTYLQAHFCRLNLRTYAEHMCMHACTPGPLLWPLLNPDSQTSVYTIGA